MMDRHSKEGNVTQEQLNEFYERGGTITKCPPGARTENIQVKGGFYGKKKKKQDTQVNHGKE